MAEPQAYTASSPVPAAATGLRRRLRVRDKVQGEAEASPSAPAPATGCRESRPLRDEAQASRGSAERAAGNIGGTATYQLPTVGYWPTVALTGIGE